MRGAPSWSSLVVVAALTALVPAGGACAHAPVRVKVPKINRSYVVLYDVPGKTSCLAWAKDVKVNRKSLVIWQQIGMCSHGAFEAKDLTVKVLDKENRDVTEKIFEHEIFHVRSIVLYVKADAPLGKYTYKIYYKGAGPLVDPQLIVDRPS